MAAALEAFLLDDGAIADIETRLGGFNIFEAIGHTRREARHSDFLAFLLDPNQTHGLGAEFLSRFFLNALKQMQRESRPLSLVDAALMNFEGCFVARERHNIDVLCIDEAKQFLLAIENKIDSGEHSDQLERYRTDLEYRYPKFHRVLVYLTPDKYRPSDENTDWTPIGYGEVLSIVEMLTDKRRGGLSEAVAMTLDHYARMLRRHIVNDKELEEKAKAVYRRHKDVLDFLFEQRSDDKLELKEYILTLLDAEKERIEVVRESKAYINFFPNDWKDISAFHSTSDRLWTRTGHSLLFEIRNWGTSIRIAVVIGPSEKIDLRRRIFDFATENPKLFAGAKRFTGEFTQIYSKSMVNRATLEYETIKDVKIEIEKWLQCFMREEFSNIVDTLAKKFS